MSRFLLLLISLWSSGLFAKGDTEPTLILDATAQVRSTSKRVFSRTELLNHPQRKVLKVPVDPSYPGRPMEYQAVPIATLFSGLNLPPDAVIEFKCTDGFAATISQSRILNSDTRRSVAYVAVEDPRRPWPKVKGGKSTAGPFYLVWDHPELSAVVQEEWPFQLAAFTVKGSLQGLYPRIFPAVEAPPSVVRGFASFTKNCFPCHTVNMAGPAQVGPDLNVPKNVTEYIEPKTLRALVRNPQSVRYYPGSRMSAFPEAILPNSELEDLIDYLAHMAGHKSTP
ncbi:MAG: c-type cytochrome [Deltaproteobacteria bacterium]|nr:c-type cytochrome [Deltaproteobacteria bacterium]